MVGYTKHRALFNKTGIISHQAWQRRCYWFFLVSVRHRKNWTYNRDRPVAELSLRLAVCVILSVSSINWPHRHRCLQQTPGLGVTVGPRTPHIWLVTRCRLYRLIQYIWHVFLYILYITGVSNSNDLRATAATVISVVFLLNYFANSECKSFPYSYTTNYSKKETKVAPRPGVWDPFYGGLFLKFSFWGWCAIS